MRLKRLSGTVAVPVELHLEQAVEVVVAVALEKVQGEIDFGRKLACYVGECPVRITLEICRLPADENQTN